MRLDFSTGRTSLIMLCKLFTRKSLEFCGLMILSGSVSQYLDGTTKNPLVNGLNKTRISDLHIFGSDGNATMKRYAAVSWFARRFSTPILFYLA